MPIKEAIKSQYHATLAMLAQAVEKCPPPLWADPGFKNQFWRLAYHALFYTHLYLHPTEADFSPWEKGREQTHFMGKLPWPPHDKPQAGEPYSQAEILEYLALLRQQIDETVDKLNLDGPSGFDWIPLNKLELQFYNIRHLQHHTGELCERLGEAAGVEVGWVGQRPS